MAAAKAFESGNGQAVGLPKQFRIKSKEVEISRRGDEIVLRERGGTMARAFDLLADLPEDLQGVPGISLVCGRCRACRCHGQI